MSAQFYLSYVTIQPIRLQKGEGTLPENARASAWKSARGAVTLKVTGRNIGKRSATQKAADGSFTNLCLTCAGSGISALAAG